MEPFKNMFNPDTVVELATLLRSHLDPDVFAAEVVPELDALELKARVDLIARALRRHLHDDYVSAVGSILESLPDKLDDSAGVSSMFILWPFCHFVEVFGVEEFDVSMDALYELTRRFSGEFAIRPLIMSNVEGALERLHRWSEDENVHVRRLVSEGTRTRLPWGGRLQVFIDNPDPVIRLLEKLKDDPEEYVRRSVANNLNDIAKDHPGLVVDVAREWWLDDDKERQRLVKRALRTLIKKGDRGALEVLGFGSPRIRFDGIELVEQTVDFGEHLEFVLRLTSKHDEPQRLLVDYTLHHLKANGTLSPKVFKWKEIEVAPGESVEMTRRHRIKPVTTRKYYEGVQRVGVSINGETYGDEPFELIFP